MRLLVRLLGLVIILVGIAVILLLMLPSDRIARIAAEQISKQTGRAVTLEGKTKLTFWPILGVSTERFTVANADWSDSGPMLMADTLKIGVRPQALWGGEVRITGLEARNPVVVLERARDGRVNWELGVQGVAPSGQGDGTTPARSERLALTLDRALIDGGSLSFIDHRSGQTTRLSGLDLDLRWPDYDGTATFEARLNPLGGPAREDVSDSDKIRITGQLDKVGDFIEGALTTVEARITAPGGAASFAGRASPKAQAEGRLSANLSDSASFLASFGVVAGEISPGMGRSATLETLVTVSDMSRIALRDSVLSLDANRLSGAADLDLSGVTPRVSAQLRAGALDLSAFAGSAANDAPGGANAPVTAGWSTAAIDASALALVDGEFALVADQIALGDLRLGKTRAKAVLDRARLVISIAELQLYDGGLSGEFVVNNRAGLSVGGALAAKGLEIQTLLRDAMGISRLTGRAAGEVRFLGVGQSMDAIMNALSGSGAIRTGRGVIEGFDLDRLMRAGDMTGGTTVFDSLTASFTMDKGQLRNDDLRLSLPLASADGTGRIGLGPRDIDYLFTPRFLDGDTRNGLAIPVRIEGPWSNPRIRPDLEKAIDLNFKEERDKLEDKAKKELNQALEKELGVTVEEGQSVEDALKDKLKEETTKGLLKLFE